MTDISNDQFSDEFQRFYETAPTIKVRCPGRVNIIGEHIDYNDYGVFPMAIEQATWVTLAPTDDNVIRISNADDQYPSHMLTTSTSWNGASPPQWYDYFLSGWKAMIDHMKEKPRGFKVMISGNVPASSGLSSSSSLVCAAALATWILHKNKGFDGITKEELADLCASAEHYVGCQGGGMDQASEILSEEGKALRIDFNPLSSKRITLPEKAQFVVLHCGETLNKAATAHYNERVVECRLAAKLLLLKTGHTSDSLRLRAVQRSIGKSLAEMAELCAEHLPEKATKEELVAILGKEEVAACLSENTKHLSSFTIRDRARHVFSEALRVDLMEVACEKGDLKRMGELMNESHESCSKDYDCSCPALDRLVADCKAAGVLGARLTGAGWGGCAVALVDASNPADLSHLKVLFTSKPSQGISFEF